MKTEDALPIQVGRNEDGLTCVSGVALSALRVRHVACQDLVDFPHRWIEVGVDLLLVPPIELQSDVASHGQVGRARLSEKGGKSEVAARDGYVACHLDLMSGEMGEDARGCAICQASVCFRRRPYIFFQPASELSLSQKVGDMPLCLLVHAIRQPQIEVVEESRSKLERAGLRSGFLLRQMSEAQ